MKKVLGDAGHGGTDPGASGNGHKEKDLTLKLALDVDKELKRHSIGSYLTRKDDRYASLEDRSKMANDLGVDVFVSYHLNSASNNNAKGLETFNYPGSTKGKELATKIQAELVNTNLCLADRGVKRANFSVLRRTNMEAALVEVCFINNKEDLDFFLKNYNKFVQSISKAIIEYLGIKYISPIKNTPTAEIEKPSIPQFTIVQNKINILLLANHIVVDGFIKEGTTYVNVNDSFISIRNILENLGLVVDWDKELGIVTADVNKEYVKEEGSTDILLLGSKINVKTYVHKDKNCLKIEGAYISVRDIFESLGFKVDWNKAINMILVTKK